MHNGFSSEIINSENRYSALWSDCHGGWMLILCPLNLFCPNSQTVRPMLFKSVLVSWKLQGSLVPQLPQNPTARLSGCRVLFHTERVQFHHLVLFACTLSAPQFVNYSFQILFCCFMHVFVSKVVDLFQKACSALFHSVPKGSWHDCAIL